MGADSAFQIGGHTSYRALYRRYCGEVEKPVEYRVFNQTLEHEFGFKPHKTHRSWHYDQLRPAQCAAFRIIKHHAKHRVVVINLS